MKPETFEFRERGMSGKIEVAQHESGHWMWATSWHCGGEGSGYAVGPKWRRFAPTREAALGCAVCEMDVQTYGNPKFKAWAETVQAQHDSRRAGVGER